MKYKKRLSPEPQGQFQPTAFECPFPRGTDRGKKESALMTLKKSSFFGTTVPISTYIGITHSWVMVIKFLK